MAKQGINPIEQHVEKIVLGVSALLFLFVVFSYVVTTPISVTVKGRTISPYDLDRQLGDAADDLARRYKNAVFVKPTTDPNAAGGTEAALEELRRSSAVLDKLPTTMSPPVGWWPELAKRSDDGGIGSSGAHGIASVSAPVVTEVHTGVTTAAMTAQPVDAFADPRGLAALLQQSLRDPQAMAGLSSQDVTWAFARLNFDMQQQYEIFRQNGYSREQANIILFMDVQLQRQRVYPNGASGPWEDVNAYKTVSFKSAPPTVSISPEGTLGQLDDQRVRQLFAYLSSAQAPLLYPLPMVIGGDGFPPYLAEGVQKPLAPELLVARPPGPAGARGAAPRATPRASIGARGGSSRGGGRGEDRGGGGRGEDRGGGGRGEDPSRAGSRSGVGMGPAARPTLDPAALQALNKAEQAYKQKRYTEAMQALEQARIGAAQQSRFQKLETEIQAAYMAWQQEEDKRQKQARDEGAKNAEIWIFDLQAQPGRTYRYRARVALFNVFSHPDIDRNELKDPQDGAQVSLLSAWSEPSQPITLASPLRFFLTGASSSGDTATIEVFRFLQGLWYNQTVHVGAGELIGDVRPRDARTNRPEMDFRTGYTVVDIGLDPAAVVETETTGDVVKIRKASSPVLVYMEDDGTIQQRWSARDSKCQLRKELEHKAKLAADQLSAMVPAPTASSTRTPPPPAAAVGLPAR